MIKTLTLAFLTTVSAFGQFLPNSVGVVYLTSESTDSYNLTIVFPNQVLVKSFKDANNSILTLDTLKYRGEITLFDKNGDLLTVEPKTNFLIQLWCDNDGGTQYRPTLKTSTKKVQFKRRLTGVSKIQNIACFVIANRNKQNVEQPNYKESNNIELEGDFNNDGKVDCFLWTYHDEAENCDGEPKNQLGINLQIGNKYFGLRCCGP